MLVWEQWLTGVTAGGLTTAPSLRVVQHIASLKLSLFLITKFILLPGDRATMLHGCWAKLQIYCSDITVTLLFLLNSWPESSCRILVGMKANLDFLQCFLVINIRCLGKLYDASHIWSVFYQLHVKHMYNLTQNEPTQMCLSCGLKLKLLSSEIWGFAFALTRTHLTIQWWLSLQTLTRSSSFPVSVVWREGPLCQQMH